VFQGVDPEFKPQRRKKKKEKEKGKEKKSAESFSAVINFIYLFILRFWGLNSRPHAC
jgi:hypothetical protein